MTPRPAGLTPRRRSPAAARAVAPAAARAVAPAAARAVAPAAARAVALMLLGAASCAHSDPAPGPTTPDGLLAVGATAPDFAVIAHDGRTIELSKLRGHYVVLYFYPKDDTSGCTKEACSFRDSWAPLQDAGVVVLGVSTQDNASHAKFADKYHLPFPLLPDDHGELTGKYHVPTTLGLDHRVTYLIDKEGVIAHVWPSVKPGGHAGEILTQIPTS
jgi:thioredoxin-dependent peroxiredoxin